jgi:hypothetical protein
MVEVRGGGSYFSQNALRVDLGLGSAATTDRIVTLTEGSARD